MSHSEEDAMPDETPKCPFGCDGSGRRRIDETTDVFCPCITQKIIAKKLGPELCSVRSTVLNGPLYQRSPEGAVVVDKTTKNLLLRGRWMDLVPHIKQALTNRIILSAQFVHRIVTDERLKCVWVGNEAYQSRSKKKRDDVETFNSLADLVGSDIDLVIIRLGCIYHPNAAMPGLLQEALVLRDSKLKPTWIIEDPDRLSWKYWQRSDVAYYLANYKSISIQGNSAPVMTRPLDDDEDEPGFGTTAPIPSEQAADPVRPVPNVTYPSEAPYSPNDFDDIDGLRDNDRKRFGKKGRRGGSE